MSQGVRHFFISIFLYTCNRSALIAHMQPKPFQANMNALKYEHAKGIACDTHIYIYVFLKQTFV